MKKLSLNNYILRICQILSVYMENIAKPILKFYSCQSKPMIIKNKNIKYLRNAR